MPTSAREALPDRPTYPMPFTRLELVVFAVLDGRLQVLLGRRAEAPHAGRWALPGGVLRIDKDADLDAACQRVAKERLGVPLPAPCLLTAVGGRRRDPRAPWALSVVYRAMVRPATLAAMAGKRLTDLRWHTSDEAVAAPLAFDHALLIQHAVEQLRSDVAALRFPAGLMDAEFTLGELQAASEAVLGKPLDKSSFRRRLDAAAAVQPIAGVLRSGPNRPAQVFCLVQPS